MPVLQVPNLSTASLAAPHTQAAAQPAFVATDSLRPQDPRQARKGPAIQPQLMPQQLPQGGFQPPTPPKGG